MTKKYNNDFRTIESDDGFEFEMYDQNMNISNVNNDSETSDSNIISAKQWKIIKAESYNEDGENNKEEHAEEIEDFGESNGEYYRILRQFAIYFWF